MPWTADKSNRVFRSNYLASLRGRRPSKTRSVIYALRQEAKKEIPSETFRYSNTQAMLGIGRISGFAVS